MLFNNALEIQYNLSAKKMLYFSYINDIDLAFSLNSTHRKLLLFVYLHGNILFESYKVTRDI